MHGWFPPQKPPMSLLVSNTHKKEMNNIKVLFRGDPFLINTYHALCQPDGATAAQPCTAKFIDFIVSPEDQALIGSFGAKEFGEGLYNDAAYAKQYDH